MTTTKSLLLVLLILVIDQWSKIYIKTSFTYGEVVEVFSWFEINFIENPGAAWGAKLDDFLPISEGTAKLVLTVFRLFAIVGIGYWLFDIIRKKAATVYIVSVSLIFAGALGNIIDSVFYGLLFDESTRTQIATFLAEDSYGPLFHGKVVDMLHFPIIENAIWPDWVPYFGGSSFSFFEPVFNIADTAISTGVGILIAFNKKAFATIPADTEEAVPEEENQEASKV